jgi:hypothetical protein
MANGKAMSQAAHNAGAFVGQYVSFFSKSQRNQNSFGAVWRRTIGGYPNLNPTHVHLVRVASGSKWITLSE